LAVDAEDKEHDDADNSDLDFDIDGGSESGFSINDDDEDSVFVAPECPELPEPGDSNEGWGGENAEGKDASIIDRFDEEGPEIVLHRDAGYEENGTKNDDYKHWRGMRYDADAGKFRWDSESTDGDVREVPKASEWTRVPPSKMKELEVTFDKGREVLLDQYVEEHNAFLRRLVELNIPKSKEGLFHHLFGKRS